jgi:hypothetical protein
MWITAVVFAVCLLIPAGMAWTGRRRPDLTAEGVAAADRRREFAEDLFGHPPGTE